MKWQINDSTGDSNVKMKLRSHSCKLSQINCVVVDPVVGVVVVAVLVVIWPRHTINFSD